MKRTSIAISLFAAVCSQAAGSASASHDRLWYETPAKEWLQAVPLGNGRLSAMVYGGVDRETIALNEISMWSGQPDSTSNNLCGPEALAEIREAFFAGDAEKGNQLGEKYLTGRMTSFGTHVPAGNIVIDFALPDKETKGYVRDLDLSEALASVSFSKGDVDYRREYIADYPDDVIAMRYTASGNGAITATVGTDLLQNARMSVEGNTICFDGKVSFPMHGPGGVNFSGRIMVLPDGGSVSHTDSTITVTDADALTLLVDLRTDYNDKNYRNRCQTTLSQAAGKGFDVLLNNHKKDYTALYDRMSIRLGEDKNSHLSTEQRMKNLADGKTDAGFDALFFQYGRYMLISSSRPSGMPLCANLQGIWNDNGACNMSWTCDYHLDMNTQQNYWSANRVNLAECNEPLFDYLGLLADHGRDAAKKIYGCRGWVAHTVCNAWGYTAPGWGVSWGLHVTGGAWLASHLWSHYLYTLDKDYLRNTAYPILRESAQFFSDYMTEDPRTGYLVSGPSISPENGYVTPDGKHLCVAMMPTIDRSMIHYIYNACIQSADILGIDDEFTASLRRDIKRMPPLAIGEDGTLNEWLEPVKRSDPSHRHSSHIHSLFPLDQISYTNEPALVEACRKALDRQTSDPAWEDTEWSTANMLCFRARTKEGDAAHAWLQNLYKRFMRENLMTVSPAGVALAEYDIFSFDATEGAVAGMCEMLMQSYDGFIEFLPALPAAWKSGEVKGLCAEGGITVDMAWENGRMKKAVLTANAGDAKVNIRGYKDNVLLAQGKPFEIKF